MPLNKGIKIDNILCLSPAETLQLCNEGALLLDTRQQYETNYKTFNVNQIKYIPKSLLAAEYKTLPLKNLIIVADSSGNSCKSSTKKLIELGLTNVACLIGGMLEWHRDGLPVVINNKSDLASPAFYNSKPKNHVKTSLLK